MLSAPRQPAFGTPITLGPLRQGLVLAMLFNGYTTFHDDAGVAKDFFYIPANTTLAFGTNKFGQYAELTTVGLQERIYSGVVGNGMTHWVPAGDLTVSLCYEKADSTNRASVAFSISYGLSGVNYACHVALPYADGNVYFQLGGGGALAATGLSFGADHWVFSSGARGTEIWQNGIKVSSDATNRTRSVDNTMHFILGGTDAAFFNSDLGRYNNLCMWDRQLVPAEIELLCANPYAPWEQASPLLLTAAPAVTVSDYYRTRQLVMA